MAATFDGAHSESEETFRRAGLRHAVGIALVALVPPTLADAGHHDLLDVWAQRLVEPATLKTLFENQVPAAWDQVKRLDQGLAVRLHHEVLESLIRTASTSVIPLDTRCVENALRGIAVGRKNHHGSRSERGTRVLALFHWLIESAKLCGVAPRAYLRETTLRAVRNPGAATLPPDLESSESRGKPALDRLGARMPQWPRTY